MTDGETDADGRDSEAPLTDEELTRRNVAKLLASIGGAAAFGGFAVDYVSGLPGDLKTGSGRLYVRGTRLLDENGDPLSASDALSTDQFDEMDVFPEKQGGGALVTHDATTLLLRYPEDEYAPPTNLDGTAKGYVAYSKVCTHEGCLVSGERGSNLECPCHGSVYDPRKGASVVGGPAPRALPQLPLGIADDANRSLLLATGPFEGPIGPED
ncbi:MAG: ubiquinol-cytochrome c reductase iron-sulfur subunit [Haloferacaceae archaeon]